jgi:dipeptidyl-peptidase-4
VEEPDSKSGSEGMNLLFFLFILFQMIQIKQNQVMRTLLSVVIFLLAHLGATAIEKITLEDIFVKGTFKSKSLEGYCSMKDGQHYTLSSEETRIMKFNYQSGMRHSVMFDLSKVDNAPFSKFTDYEFSSDETKILLTTGKKKIYRHSYTAEYYVWNSVTEELIPLSEKGRQQYAAFSPDGDKIAFVRENNLFIKNLKFGTESQVTLDGSINKIINGAPDWVYEEEFGIRRAFAWSPDSKFLAFIRFDESDVRDFSITLFRGDQPALEENALYPQNKVYKYPKAGEANSKVTVRIYDIRSKATIKADTGSESDIYIPDLRWTPDGNDLAIMRLNRRQNQLDLLYTNPNTGGSRLIFTEKNARYLDFDFSEHFVFLDDGKFVITSERNGYSHLYLHDRLGVELAQITSGNFDVTAFYGFDPARKLFYYQAAAELPLRREVYYTSSDGKKKGKLSEQPGTNSAEFSKGFNYFLNHHTGSTEPPSILLCDWKGKKIRVMEDNKALKKRVAAFSIPRKEFFTFRVQDGTVLNGWMLKPPGFSQDGQYPVVMTQYSGPGSQDVTDRWGVSWNEYLAQEGFLVVCVDPRGTGGRGEDFRKITYLRLGKYESDDLVETAAYLSGLPFVDRKKIAVWGWSYGGFTTILTMAKGGDLIRAGIAVAPVTSWRYYDNIYTERYMRTPDENTGGYDENSTVKLAGNIKGRLLLVHGSADDNVHLQNTMELSEALVQEGIQFDMAIYANRNHGIRGGNTSLHLYRKMTDFLIDQLKGKRN